ncbi:hypothetical protein NL676_010179 [Syzygium grande]|nr:hypothetical protein NL676_010179 [Syzygium grande]
MPQSYDDDGNATDSQAFHSNGNTNSLPPAAANMQGDTCNEACWAFGSPSANPLPPTSMAARGVDSEWAHQLMNMEMDPFDDYQLTSVMNLVQEDTHHTTFQAFCSDANDVNSLLMTMTAVQQDTCGSRSLAFGGTTCLPPPLSLTFLLPHRHPQLPPPFKLNHPLPWLLKKTKLSFHRMASATPLNP